MSRTDARPAPELVDAVFDSWLPGAMFPSELFWLHRVLMEADVDHVVECGRQDGVSTWTLATLLASTDVAISSIDFASITTSFVALPKTRIEPETRPTSIAAGFAGSLSGTTSRSAATAVPKPIHASAATAAGAAKPIPLKLPIIVVSFPSPA